jgi:hypothetical protein
VSHTAPTTTHGNQGEGGIAPAILFVICRRSACAGFRW